MRLNYCVQDNKRRIQQDNIIEQQRQSIEDLKKLNAVMEAEKEVLRTEVSEFEEQLEREIHAHALKSEEIAKLDRRKEDLEMQLAHEKKLHQDALDARVKTQEQVTQLEQQIAQLMVDGTGTAHTLDELRRELEVMTRSRDQMKAHRDDALEELQRSHEQYDQLAKIRGNLEHEVCAVVCLRRIM